MNGRHYVSIATIVIFWAKFLWSYAWGIENRPDWNKTIKNLQHKIAYIHMYIGESI